MLVKKPERNSMFKKLLLQEKKEKERERERERERESTKIEFFFDFFL